LKISLLVAALMAALIPAGLVAVYNRPLSPVTAEQVVASDVTFGSRPSLAWPGQGQAAIGLEGLDVLETSGAAKPLPTASVAKVMTALLTLEGRPLSSGETGPSITVTDDDVITYQQDRAEGQSVVEVAVGEQLTEYQALQALLLPSANNIATLLARWIAGSELAFSLRMNARAAQIGMTQSTFADASGFSPQTVSVPADLVRLGQAAMRNPVFAEIVDQQQVTLPIDGLRNNVNAVLGLDGIVGIKTGNTDQAPGVYLAAAVYQVPAGPSLLIVLALQGQPSLATATGGLPGAFDAARTLLASVRSVLKEVRLVSRGQTVGRYRASWGGQAAVQAASDLDTVVWPGRPLAIRLEARSILPPLAGGTIVGTLEVTTGSRFHLGPVPVVAGDPLESPGARWRLTPHSVPPPASQARPH
jgi:serine-type D-Ala-D-Ala carboxypeptidase (penicillin-binding protein 5/6)